MTTQLTPIENYLHLILETEALLVGGQSVNRGLPTCLQTALDTLKLRAIGASLWDIPVKLDFHTAFGDTHLLMSDDAPQLRQVIKGRYAYSDPITCFPIVTEDGQQGVLQAVPPQNATLSEVEITTLQIICKQIGVALSNAARFERMRRQRTELNWLYKVGDSLLNLFGSLKIDEVAWHIMSAVNEMLEVEETSIMLRDRESDDLILWKNTPPERDLAIRLKIGEGIAGWVMEHGQPAIVNDVQEDSRWEARFDEPGIFETRSLLAMPILLDGHVEGVIEAVNKIDGNFTDEDEEMIGMLANWAAIAIGNANAYQELQRTHERLADAKKHAAMAQMVLNLAHRINNSVGAVRVWAVDSLADMQGDDISLFNLKNTLESILTNAEETLTMVRRIRSATELPAADIKAVQVNNILSLATNAVRLPPSAKVAIHAPDNLPPIAADPERLVEVLINLIDNAADAKATQIDLRAHHTAADRVEIDVQDNGTGIPQHMQNALFDPFITSKNNGLGLGLWMVKLYIELIEGQIEMTTTPDKGTTFRISLPLWTGQTDE